MSRNILLTIVICLCLIGCRSYRVGVNSYLAESSNINRNKTVFVLVNQNVTNPLLAKEVATKIERYLTQNGIEIAKEIGSSDYVLTFAYDIDSGETSSSSHTYTSTVYKLNVHSGKYELVPKTHTYNLKSTKYNRYLIVTLFDSHKLVSTNEGTPIWVAEVTSRGKNSELRKVIDYLIVAAFEHYGEDTQGIQKHTLQTNDKRIDYLY